MCEGESCEGRICGEGCAQDGGDGGEDESMGGEWVGGGSRGDEEDVSKMCETRVEQAGEGERGEGGHDVGGVGGGVSMRDATSGSTGQSYTRQC